MKGLAVFWQNHIKLFIMITLGIVTLQSLHSPLSQQIQHTTYNVNIAELQKMADRQLTEAKALAEDKCSVQ